MKHWSWGAGGGGKQGEGRGISTVQKGAILLKCLNTLSFIVANINHACNNLRLIIKSLNIP